MPARVVTVLIPLPLFYNPDEHDKREPVEDEKFVVTGEEVGPLFGGCTLFVFRQSEARGFWWNRGFVDQDVLALLEVDIEDTEAARAQLRCYVRDVLKARFRQKAMYLKFVPIETVLVTDERIE